MNYSTTDESSSEKQASTALNADTAGQGADNARTEKLLYGNLTRSVIAGFYAVYVKLGFGFLENVYAGALTIELRRRGHQIAREVGVAVSRADAPVGGTSSRSLCRVDVEGINGL